MSTTTMTISRMDNGEKSLEAIELDPKSTRSRQSLSKKKSTTENSSVGGKLGHDEENIRDQTEPPETAQPVLQSWNRPRSNIGRVVAAFFSFFVMGMNDATPGALIPYLEEYYNLSYAVISVIFLTPFVGYSAAALANASIHIKLGQRGIAAIAPICQIIPYVVLSVHPPFPVIVVVNGISGFGSGLIDAAWSAWAGHMTSANAVQGCLHACYSLGATFSPLIATSMITQYNRSWYEFYYVMVGAATLEFVILASTFWSKDAEQYRIEHPKNTQAKEGRLKEALKQKTTLFCSAFFFIYVGAEVALGGWIVTFMLRVRSASNYVSGISATGFWAGMAAGRAGLGFVTERFGERLCVTIYLAAAIALELIFWLVPQYIVSAVAVAFLGFFMGPLFPAGVIMATKLLPSHLHVSAIGFAAAIGGTGGTIFPFIVGAIAQAKGVAVLQPVILALLAVLAVIWFMFPKVKKRD